MKPLLVLSVPHCGTMFTFDLLPGIRGHLHEGIKEGHKYWTHIGEPGAAEAARQCFTIIPVRSLAAVERSWLSRGMNLARLHSLWVAMHEIPADFVLRLDAKDRDAQLSRLSKKLGVHIATDWSPTNRHAA